VGVEPTTSAHQLGESIIQRGSIERWLYGSNPTRTSLVSLKLITIENSKSLKRHAFLETLLKKLNTESIYYKHVLSFNIMRFLLMMLLWWSESIWENSEPYKSGGPHIRDKRSHYTLVTIILSM
jgi:hypothetical protein